MLNYKPKEKPLLNQILGSAVFQVGVLLVAAFFVGQYLLRNSSSEKFVQRMFKSQGVTRSQGARESAASEADENSNEETNEAATHNRVQTAPAGNGQTADGATTAGEAGKSALAANGAGGVSTGKTAEVGSPNIRLIYAEVPVDMLNRWIVDSSAGGLYQSLPDYAVGILYDFHKRNDKFVTLKSSDLKILVGSSNNNISGTMSDDGSQLVGLSAAIELKSTENDVLTGSISVTKSGRVGNESFPSEFELPKGAAFFIIGTLKVDNFAQERSKLQMPPFQVFKSQDFMTRKTEFVIILEPVYK